MDENKIISLENLNQYSDETSDKIKSYVNTKTSVIQDGTKTVGGVSAEDYNNFKGAYEDKHTHSNKSVLDEISEKTLNGGEELSGSTGYTVTDSVEYPLVGLKVFGKSTQDGTPTPENPVEIVSVVEPTVTVCGKNLLNISGNRYLNDTNISADSVLSNLITDKKTNFSLRVMGSGWDRPPELIYEQIYTTGNYSYNFSLSSDCTIYVKHNGSTNDIRLFSLNLSAGNYVISFNCMGINASVVDGIKLSNIQIEKGSTATAYEPYTAKSLTLPDTLNAIPVSSGGNVTIDGQEFIADYVDYERRVKVKRTIKITYSDGYEVKGIDILGNYARIPILIGTDNLTADNNTNSLCDIMPYLLSYSSDSLHHYIQDKYIWAFVPVTELTTQDVAGAKEWLSIKQPTFIYVLATPIETPISESELQAYRQLHTYNGVTNISNDKGAGIEVNYCTSKMLVEYALPLIKDLEAENANKDEEISVLKTDILNNENKITELQNENSLNEKVKFLNNMQRTGKVYTVRFPLWETSQTCNGEKLDDNAGLVCNPSTATTRGISDYDNIPLFITYDCNAYVDEDGIRHITAIKGDENYRDTGKVDVFVLGTSYYEKSWVEDGYMYYSCTDLPRDGYVLASECKTKDGKDQGFALYPKCFAGDIDGKPYGSFGLVPARYCSDRPAGSQNISYSGNISYFHQRGSHYSGTFASELKYITTRWWLKYGTRNSQSVMAGCTDYAVQYVATVAETGVKRIIITNANAAYFEVGMPVSIGTNTDRNVWACHNKAESATITAIEAYDDNNKAIYVDVDTAFDTTTTTYISTFHWRSGFSNKVLGRDGSPCPTSAGLTNGKYPAVIQGIECFVGVYDTVSNTMADIVDSTGKREVYITNDSTKLSADITAIKSTYSKVAGQITPVSLNTWNYITAVDCDVENGIIVPTAAGQSGSSTTTGYADGLYCDEASSGQREILCFGALGHGSRCGVSCLLAHGGLGHAYWTLGARLSVNG